MTTKIYEVMQKYEIIPDNRIRLMYIEHRK